MTNKRIKDFRRERRSRNQDDAFVLKIGAVLAIVIFFAMHAAH